jgi:RimJ/RimL family protein N-acetyltransferase
MRTTEPETRLSARGENVLIRCASLDDAEPLLEFTRLVTTEPNATLTEWDEIDGTTETERQFIEHAMIAGNLLLLADVQGKLVGMLNFSTHRKRKLSHAGEFGMSILKEFRDQGIGRMLLNALLTWTSKQPALERLELNVFAGNARAIHLYRSVGFEEQGRSRNAIKFSDGRYDDLILMARSSR